uniref:Uncharacterized protein n=2 Tax=Lygus hesperus TaxID=30085 RepID=A0A146LNY9_LYGHE
MERGTHTVAGYLHTRARRKGRRRRPGVTLSTVKSKSPRSRILTALMLVRDTVVRVWHTHLIPRIDTTKVSLTFDFLETVEVDGSLNPLVRFFCTLLLWVGLLPWYLLRTPTAVSDDSHTQYHDVSRVCNLSTLDTAVSTPNHDPSYRTFPTSSVHVPAPTAAPSSAVDTTVALEPTQQQQQHCICPLHPTHCTSTPSCCPSSCQPTQHVHHHYYVPVTTAPHCADTSCAPTAAPVAAPTLAKATVPTITATTPAPVHAVQTALSSSYHQYKMMMTMYDDTTTIRTHMHTQLHKRLTRPSRISDLSPQYQKYAQKLTDNLNAARGEIQQELLSLDTAMQDLHPPSNPNRPSITLLNASRRFSSIPHRRNRRHHMPRSALHSPILETTAPLPNSPSPSSLPHTSLSHTAVSDNCAAVSGTISNPTAVNTLPLSQC